MAKWILLSGNRSDRKYVSSPMFALRYSFKTVWAIPTKGHVAVSSVYTKMGNTPNVTKKQSIISRIYHENETSDYKLLPFTPSFLFLPSSIYAEIRPKRGDHSGLNYRRSISLTHIIPKISVCHFRTVATFSWSQSTTEGPPSVICWLLPNACSGEFGNNRRIPGLDRYL